MQILQRLFVVICCLLFMTEAYANGREISQSELRNLVASGRSVTLDSVFSRIRNDTGGDPVDVRAFSLEDVYYKVMVVMPNGKLVSIVVEAQSGRFLPPQSYKALAICELASRTEDRSLRRNHQQQRGHAHTHGHNGHSHVHSHEHNN